MKENTDKKILRSNNEAFNFNSLRLAVCDLNGILRGKRFPSDSVEKLFKSGCRMPLSTSCIDIWGTDLINSPYLFETGDADGVVKPIGLDLIPINWLGHPTSLLLSWMYDENNQPSLIDPRQILSSVINKYTDIGLTPVIAFELEFYLLDPVSNKPIVAKNPINKTRLLNTSVLSIDELDIFENFFFDVCSACKDHNIPSDTVISENGIGQFEINLKHTFDTMAAADHVIFFKRIVKGVAKKHSLKASFMPKPFLESAGSGMHIHMSIVNDLKENIFDSRTEAGLISLKNAVGGLINALKESMLIFAPHLNSYRRLKPGSHAPTSICWGYENRTASIRIPGGASENTRIEHRVAGADANPYLVAASVLAAALNGIQKEIRAPKPIKDDSYKHNLEKLPNNWPTAIKMFKSGPLNRRFYSDTFVEVFSNLKLQEFRTFADRMENFEVSTYLENI